MIMKHLLLLVASCVFIACNSGNNSVILNEPETDGEGEVNNGFTQELQLSVESFVVTNDIDYDFEILKGNEPYSVNVANKEDAKTTITGNKVTVNLLNSTANITVTDSKLQSKSIQIYSSAPSLSHHGYTLVSDPDSTHFINNLDFGSGGYTIKKIKGSSATAEIEGTNNLKITSIKPGNSYFQIIDKRGSIAPLEVVVLLNYILTNKSAEIIAIPDEVISIPLQYGEGDWQLTEDTSSSNLIEEVTLMPKGSMNKYDVLQINTTKTSAVGMADILLKDKVDNYARITIKIQP